MLLRKTRLVAVQGPTQLLCALAVLEKQDAETTGCVYDDYLVIHGLAADPREPILQATMSLARVRPWHAVVDLSDLDEAELAEPAVAHSIQARIGVATVDQIYVVRNWQQSNEALLRTYVTAEKIVYGDSFGIMDSFWWPGFIAPDRAELCLPIELEFGALDRIPCNIVARHYLESIISAFIEATPDIAIQSRELADWMGNYALLLMGTNGVESNWIPDVPTEIALSVEHVLRYVQPGQKVVIKAHPRECYGQSEATRKILEHEHGIPTIVVSGILAPLPIEVFCRELHFSDVLTLISTGAVQLKYLYGIECRTADDDITLPKLRPQSQYDYGAYLGELRTLMVRLDDWDGRSILYRRGPDSPQHWAELTCAIDRLTAGDHDDALVLFERLARAGCNLPQVAYGRAAALLGQGKTIRGLLALRKLKGGPYAPVGSRLLDGQPRLQWIRSAFRRLRGSHRRRPIEISSSTLSRSLDK